MSHAFKDGERQALMCFVLLHQQWVADGSPTHSTSTPVKVESALQFVPTNTNPKEFKTIQKMVSVPPLDLVISFVYDFLFIIFLHSRINILHFIYLINIIQYCSFRKLAILT